MPFKIKKRTHNLEMERERETKKRIVVDLAVRRPPRRNHVVKTNEKSKRGRRKQQPAKTRERERERNPAAPRGASRSSQTAWRWPASSADTALRSMPPAYTFRISSAMRLAAHTPLINAYA